MEGEGVSLNLSRKVFSRQKTTERLRHVSPSCSSQPRKESLCYHKGCADRSFSPPLSALAASIVGPSGGQEEADLEMDI